MRKIYSSCMILNTLFSKSDYLENVESRGDSFEMASSIAVALVVIESGVNSNRRHYGLYLILTGSNDECLY